MYNSSLSRECIIHPGQEEKDGTFPDENPLPTTPNVYVYILNIELPLRRNRNRFMNLVFWISFTSRGFDSFFFFFFFLFLFFFRWIVSHQTQLSILEWWPPRLSVPRIISRRRIPLSFSIYLKRISLPRMIQPANYETRSRAARSNFAKNWLLRARSSPPRGIYS